MDEEVHDALDDEGQDEEEDELGQLVLGKVDELGVPAAFEGFDESLILNEGLLKKGRKEDDGVVSLSESRSPAYWNRWVLRL